MTDGAGGFGGFDLSKMMEAAQSMQDRLAEMQGKLDTLEVEGGGGGGLVKATVTAKGELKRLSIDPSLFVPDEREVVEDLIVAAIRDAQTRAAQTAQAEAQKMAQGMGLPPGMNLPF